MKLVIFVLSLLVMTSAQARSIQIQESICMTKQKNAASFALAQKAQVPVQNIVVKEYLHGMWTEMPGPENSGSDTVGVAVKTSRISSVVYFEVKAKQIGLSGDCKITQVIQMEN